MTVGDVEAAAWALVGTVGYLLCEFLTQSIASRRQLNLQPLETSERVITYQDPEGTVRLTVLDAVPEDSGTYQLTADAADGTQEVTSTHVVIEESDGEEPTSTQKDESYSAQSNYFDANYSAPPQHRKREAPKPLPPVRVRATARGSFERPLIMEEENAPPGDEGSSEVVPSEEQTEATQQTTGSVSEPPVSEDTVPDDGGVSSAKSPERRRSSAAGPTRRRSSAVGEPPAIEEALSGVRAVAGCPGRLEGRISGKPRPLVTWTRAGATLAIDGERVRTYHEDDGTFGLEITECQEEDAGLYEATASNPQGSASTDAELEIIDMNVTGKEWAPDFTTPLLGGTFDEGGSFELDTHVTGVPIPEITWTKDGVPLDEDERISIGFDSDKAVLSVKEVATSDAGRYDIIISNSLGEASSSVEVKVRKIYQAPQFIEPLNDVQQMPSLDAKFACKVTGIPQPSVEWLFNGKPIKSGKKCKIRRDGETCTLSVRDCEEEDAGQYVCRAINVEGSADGVATLQIVDKLERKPKQEAPVFLKTLGDCEVFPGMQARFTACIAGYPEPECEWTRNDVRIYPSDRIHMEADGSGLVRLTLRTVDETDAGRYRLTVQNSQGKASCEADLTYDSFEVTTSKPLKDQYQTLEKELRSGVPMQLADPPIVSRMVDRQLTLSWKPCVTAGQRIPPTYIVEMAKMPEGDFGIVHHGVRGCSVEIKRLEPHCDYKFRVIAENKHGASEPSPHVIAHRKDLVPAPEDAHPTLSDKEQFRPGSSHLFPRGFDMEKYSGGRPHPPTGDSQTNGKTAEDDGSWRYDRFDPDAATSRLNSQRLVQPFPASYHPPANVPSSAERPGEPQPPGARVRPLTDDVDGYVPALGGRHRRQAHGEEWEQKRGSNIVERLLVRKQMEEAAKSFKRSAGLENRGLMRLMKPRGERASERAASIGRRLNIDDDDDVSATRVRPTPLPVRSSRPVLSDGEDELDSPSLYSRNRYSRAPSETRQNTRARSVLDDDDDDDDDILLHRRQPAYHTRTASLIAAANNDDADNDDEDYDITSYLRRPPRLMGTRDWGVKSTPAPRPTISSRDREFQERRDRHAELIQSRSQLPPPAQPVSTDWQSEFDRYMSGIRAGSGASKHSATASGGSTAKEVKKPADLTSARDWESRFSSLA